MKTFLAGCLATLALAGGAQAAEIVVLSAGAVKAVVPEIAAAFEQETGHKVKLSFDPVGTVRKRAASEPVDVLILSDTALEDMTRQGEVVAGTRVDIARTALGVGVKEGAPKPDISTPDALKQSLLAAKSIVYVDPARGATSGIHFASVLQRLGIADAMKGKTLLYPGGFAAEAVVDGRAELVVHLISEILPVRGVVIVGPLPKELQKVVTYSAGLAAKSTNADAARTFLTFIARPAFKPKFAAAGMDYKE